MTKAIILCGIIILIYALLEETNKDKCSVPDLTKEPVFQANEFVKDKENGNIGYVIGNMTVTSCNYYYLPNYFVRFPAAEFQVKMMHKDSLERVIQVDAIKPHTVKF